MPPYARQFVLTSDDVDRFWAGVDKSAGPDGCWPWQRAKSRGYGYFSVRLNDKHTSLMAHRTAYVLTHGDPGAGLVIDHLCRNRQCCNPAHLEPVTPGENVLRGEGPTAQNAKKTICETCGGPLDGWTKCSGRHCIKCTRQKRNAYTATRRGLINERQRARRARLRQEL